MGAVYWTAPGKGADDLKDLTRPVSPEDQGDIDLFRAGVLGLEQYVPKSRLRRVDHYSRLALLAAGRALEDCGGSFVSRDKTGVIVATGYGALGSTFSFLDSYIERGDKLAFPTHFSNSVHNAAAAHISICYKITGPSLTVSQFDLSFISALITAGTWLETGKTDAVLIGTVDEWCEIMGYCMNRFSGISDTPASSFGEGAAFFMVTRETGPRPQYGFFEDISMGRNPDESSLCPGDILFSPSSAALTPGDLQETLEGRAGVWERRKAGSPTDMGMDALFAFGRQAENGRKICCLKQGEAGMYGKMTICVPGETTI